MTERLAIIAASLPELAEALTAFLDGREDRMDLHRGRVRRSDDALALFADDEDMAAGIDAWIAKGKLSKLAELWVGGLTFDWRKLHGETTPRRVSLPTYPFARERHWAPDAGVGGPASAQARREERFLQKQWEPAPVDPAGRPDGIVAILASDETRALAARLADHFPGSRVLDLQDPGSGPRPSEENWTRYDGLVDLVGCGEKGDPSMAWIPRLQGLIEHGRGEGLMLLCATRGLESGGNAAIHLSGASRAGLYRMLQSEYRRLHSRHMDVEISMDDETLAGRIAAEFMIRADDPEIRYRGGERLRARLEEIRVEGRGDGAAPFPGDHVLWITGGTRGIGFLCARHFVARHGVRKLVLAGREIPPPRNEWDARARGADAMAGKIRAIRALESEGARVEVLSTPLTDEQALRKSLEEIRKTLGPIGGIIHCAGMVDMENPAFIRKTVDGIRRVLAPKTVGVDVMHRVFKDEPTRFFVLFSSVSAIIPGLAPGQGDYAMANAYMDYFAAANTHETPMVSIQWPSWKETGMGESRSGAYDQTGLLSLTDAEGLGLLDRILAGGVGPAVLPAMVNPDRWRPRELMARPPTPAAPAAAPRTVLTRTGEAADAADPGPNPPGGLVEATREWLGALFVREMKMDPSRLETEAPFQDYGLDSVLLAQLFQRIGQELAIDPDPSVLYEYPTIDALGAWLARAHGAAVSRVLETPSAEGAARPAPGAREDSPSAPAAAPGAEPAARASSPVPGRPNRPESLDIAVVGLSCRFPGADDLEAYWRLLSEGRSAIGPAPPRRGSADGVHAGFLDDVSRFDPGFFLLSEADARAMDPQARLLLEVSLDLWRHAGYSLDEIRGRSVGVYVGGRAQHSPDPDLIRKARNPIMAVGQNYLAANISQFFDLRGPALVLDTACSSALVGMNMAIHALRVGEISAALVGGVNLLNTDGAFRMFQQRGLLQDEPAFHIFDGRAGGVVLGEGAGVVLLKTAARAMEEKDAIYAVIRALAVNNDGRTPGPATPNPEALKAVMRTALAQSGREPGEIRHIEANGSGSEVTDLLELKAIQSVYRSNGAEPLGLGSIKPNIGHPLCAEGMASFIKAALMQRERRLAPFLSGQTPMKHFDMEASPFYFQRTAAEWTDAPRIAAVNCFGDGGTNAHVILEEWEETGSRSIERGPMAPPALDRYDIYAGRKAERSNTRNTFWKRKHR